ncbi:hypothetical protein Tco_0861548 [Tanacetum coccineum]|uniref:Reverse transcriptase domain-containing protein n=1 Tax=Tanacetum coccineum TaxID=301880 RepID=A0ABQ5BLE5_9ASTR
MRLNVISCTKVQKYLLKGFPIFLAHVTTKEVEDKSKKKRLEDASIVRDFPEVFPEDLSSLPLTRQVEFQIDLVPGVAPVARAPYRHTISRKPFYCHPINNLTSTFPPAVRESQKSDDVANLPRHTYRDTLCQEINRSYDFIEYGVLTRQEAYR